MSRVRHTHLALVALLLGASACASTTAILDGVAVPRLTQSWGGQPYSVEHQRAHPRPGGPSSGLHDDGGSISGKVCGMDVEYGVDHRRDHVQLIGFVDQSYPSQIQVRDAGGERLFTGNVSGQSVDLKLKSSELSGHVGLHVLFVVQEGNRLVGHLRAANIRGALPIVLDGRDALWSMPAAAQAAVLPALLMCQIKSSDWGPAQGWRGGFGGVPQASPYRSSTLYSAGR